MVSTVITVCRAYIQQNAHIFKPKNNAVCTVILYGEVNEKTSNAKLEILGIVSDISKGITGPPSLSDPSLYNCFLFAFMNAFKFFSD